jgi:hypothetical protein
MNKQYDRTETSIPFTRKAVARAPCTCGELAQGFLDGEHVVISAPIDRYSVAVALKPPADSPGIGASGVGWEVAAPGFPKTDAVLARAQEAGWLLWSLPTVPCTRASVSSTALPGSCWILIPHPLG